MKTKLDALVSEHGSIGDERLILMAALTLADELFDARSDVDELLNGATSDERSPSSRSADTDASDTGDRPRLAAKR